MNIQRLALAVVVIYLVMWGLAIAIYDNLLAEQFAAFQAYMRPEDAMGSAFPIMLVGYLIQVTLFCVIFTKNFENKGIGEGVRFGLIAGGMLAAVDLTYGMTLAVPVASGVLAAVISLAMWVVAGVLLSLIYKPKAA